MKKVYLALLALGVTGMLAACGSSSNDDLLIKEGKSVVTQEMMQANYRENYDKKEVTYTSIEVKIPEGYTYDPSDLGPGGSLILAKDGKYGVFSLVKNQFLIEARLVEKPVCYSNNEVGFDVKYKEPANSKWYLADGVGNIIYQSAKEFTFNGISFKFNQNEVTGQYDVLVSRYRIYDPAMTDERNEAVYFKYSDKFVATKITAEQYYQVKEASKGEVPYNEARVYDLSEYGLDRTLKFYGDNADRLVAKVYEADGTEKATFEFINGYTVRVLGTKIFAQRLVKETANANRAKLTSKIINLESLKESNWDVPAYIEAAAELKKASSEDPLYFAVSLTEYAEDGYKGATRVMIMDEDGGFHDDITRKNFVSWLRLSNGYFYDYATLYDADFNIVFDARGASFDNSNEVFRVWDGTNYALINNQGKRIHDTKVTVTDTTPIFNGVYRMLNLGTGLNGYINAKDGSTFRTGTTVKEKYRLTESIIEDSSPSSYDDTPFVLKTETTYNDTEMTSVKSVSTTIRTLDGVQLVAEEKAITGLYVSLEFGQNLSRGKAYACSYTVNAVDKTLIFSSISFELNPIAAPTAA